MRELHIACSIFAGTLAALAKLVNSGAVDIYSIRLSEIAEQVAAAILDPDTPLDPEDAGAELVLCAGLLRHKSRYMLPADKCADATPEEEQSDESLLAPNTWLTCQQYKAAAEVLENLALDASRLYPRGMTESRPSAPPRLQTSLMALVMAFQDALENSVAPLMEIPRDEFTVSEAILHLQGLFSGQAHLRVGDLFPLGSTRLHIIVLFLGLLELIKLGQVDLFDSECGELFLYAQEAGRVA